MKDALLWIWTALLQKSIARGVKDFCKRLEACVSEKEGILKIKFYH